jgi:hypothetical protein
LPVCSSRDKELEASQQAMISKSCEVTEVKQEGDSVDKRRVKFAAERGHPLVTRNLPNKNQQEASVTEFHGGSRGLQSQS